MSGRMTVAWLATTALATAGTLLAVAAPGGATAAPGRAPTVLTVTFTPQQVANVDSDGSGDGSPGDLTLVSGPIRNQQDVRIGRGQVVCTSHFDGQRCEVTFRLHRGDLQFAGMALDSQPGPFVLAVTGGTGTFSSVAGEAVSETGEQQSTVTITLE